MQVYSLSLSEKVSPAGGEEEEGGEAVDVMMERREAVDERTTGEGVVRALAFLRER